ncbi:hypothetical protein ACIQMJ_27690 [Actinosynnema sp. NPDC091369]
MIDYRVPSQIAAVWVVTGLSAAFVGWLVLFGFFVGSAALVGVGMLGPFVVVYLVGTLVPAGSPLTAGPLRRVGWAALVTVLGLVGAVFYHAVVEASTPAKPPTWLVLPAVGTPFALVAAMLAHGLAVRLAAVAVTVAAVAFGLWFPTTMPADDPASRIRNAGVPGGVLLIATPEGYLFPSLSVDQDRVTYRYTPSAPVGAFDASPRLVVRPATDEEVERFLPAAPGRRDRDVLRPFADTWARLF